MIMRSKTEEKRRALLSGIRFVLGRIAIVAIVVLAFLWLTKGPEVATKGTAGAGQPHLAIEEGPKDEINTIDN